MFRLRLKELREGRGMSQAQFAEKLGIAQSTVGMWESGRREPNFEMLLQISSFFGIHVDEILGGSNLAPLPDALRGGKLIDVLGRVPAGTPVEAVESIVDTVELSEKLSNDGHDYFALLFTGDSMYPEYKDGDIVIARKQSTADTNDDDIAYVNGCDATLKRIAVSEKGITLRAVNPAHESYSYSNEDVERLPVVILGVVKELRRTR